MSYPLPFLNAADTAPSNTFIAVAPNDGADLSPLPCRALYIGTGGSVSVVGPQGASAVSFANVPSGSILPVRASRVMATGTTATGIVALY